jgi:hypothetical protein
LAVAQEAQSAVEGVKTELETELETHSKNNVVHIKDLGMNPNIDRLVAHLIYKYTIDITY